MKDMFSNVDLSNSNYENLLQVLACSGEVMNNVVFIGGLSQYCNGVTEKNILIAAYNWTISDGGIDMSCSSCSTIFIWIGITSDWYDCDN